MRNWENLSKGWPPLDYLALTFAIYLLTLCPTYAEAEIRCYCNHPSCISTGYMCKSAVGRCYSQITHEGEAAHSAHGCAENLQLPDRNLCETGDDVIKTRSDGGDWPVLMCCKEDMCNYMDIKIKIPLDSKSNKSILGDKSVSTHEKNSNYRLYEERQSALWFKAAVIAVPIAGGFILLLLVILAIRLLRSDNRRHRQILDRRRHSRGFLKAQLFVADHFCDNHTHFIPQIQRADSCKHNNIYKEISVARTDGKGYEQILDSSHDGSCNSIIVWGKGGKLDPKTLV